MRHRFGLPLAVSLVGHGALLIVLLFLMTHLPPTPLLLRLPKGGIEVLLTPPPAPAPPAAPAVPRPEPPPPIVKTEPPPPPPPAVKPELPAPPAARHATPRTRISPPARQPPPTREPATERPMSPVPSVSVPPPTPAAPAAPAAPLVSAGYRAALSVWLERHKQYPESARARGEEGQAVLRFRVDRSGRVLGFSIVRSTGYPDLDAAIDRMMRGAVLPPFPTDMTAAEIDVSVSLRFALSH